MVDEIVENTSLVIFQGKQFRRLWYNNEWYYSVIDIIAFLTDQEDFQTARKYWNKLSQRLREEGSEVVTNCHQLKLPAPDGKLRETDCANTKSLFRIIQSVPSKKAEPLKLWLAQVGYDRVQEIENPELAQKRIKELERENLRDHMNDLELIFTMLGKRVSTEITKNKEAKGFRECEDAAIEGGQVAGNARKDAEKRIGKSIITDENYLHFTEDKKKRKLIEEKK